MGSTVSDGPDGRGFSREKRPVHRYCLSRADSHREELLSHTSRTGVRSILAKLRWSAFCKVFNYASACEGRHAAKPVRLDDARAATSEAGLSERRSRAIRMTRDQSVSLFAQSDSIYAPLSPEMLPPVPNANCFGACKREASPAQNRAGSTAECCSCPAMTPAISAWSLATGLHPSLVPRPERFTSSESRTLSRRYRRPITRQRSIVYCDCTATGSLPSTPMELALNSGSRYDNPRVLHPGPCRDRTSHPGSYRH